MSSVIHAPHLTKLGLGGAVAKVARPIARIIDRTTSVLPKPLQTRVAQCGGCRQREAALNRLVPDVRNPFAKKD